MTKEQAKRLWLTIGGLILLMLFYDFAYNNGVDDTIEWYEDEQEEFVWKSYSPKSQ